MYAIMHDTIIQYSIVYSIAHYTIIYYRQREARGPRHDVSDTLTPTAEAMSVTRIGWSRCPKINSSAALTYRV